MKKIKLSQNKYALVDDDDFVALNQYNWSATKHRKTFYARGRVNGKMTAMHRLIMKLTNPKRWVDHIDRNGLNNQKSNLRLCTPAESAANRSSFGTSKFRGVFYLSKKRRWVACIQHQGRYKRIGSSFKNEVAAAAAYNEAAKKHHKEFANLNII